MNDMVGVPQFVNAVFQKKSKKILINSYTGLGDFLIMGPCLQAAAQTFPDRIVCLENPVVLLYKKLQIDYLSGIETIERSIRHFAEFHPEDLAEEMKLRNIGFVINLRRDCVRNREQHERIFLILKRQGIVVLDLSWVIEENRQRHLHFYQLVQTFFFQLGIRGESDFWGWLKKNIRFPDWAIRPNDTIGFFTGASQLVKRLPVDFWVSLITAVSKKESIRPILFLGVTDEEKSEGKHIVDKLLKNGIGVTIVTDKSLFDLSEIVAGMRMMVSPDTFMVHFAESLGVKVFGIYNSTNPLIYGPQHEKSHYFFSPYYWKCPQKNDIGNCEGWDAGCLHMTCKDFVSADKVSDEVIKMF